MSVPHRRLPIATALVLVSGALAVLGPAAPAVAAPATAQQVLDSMTLPQVVGQLFMVGTPAARVDRRTEAQIRRLHVGNIILTGRSRDGLPAPRRVVAAMRAQVSGPATHDVRLFVAADQEGGQVQVLQGRGFSRMPTALVQGTWRPSRVRSAAEGWAGQLRRVGVNLDLAPVLDTVPGRRAARHNPPIGQHDRELGYTPAVVTRAGVAFVRGMRAGRVATAVKHFPGLGRVRADTDTAARVTDRVTKRHDPYLRPFAAAVDAGTAFVMMSHARYLRLDAQRPAAFSPYVIGTVLRGDLGFRGVVISDDLADARQVAGVAPGERALRFLAAGGDLVLVVDPAPVPEMYHAVLDRARQDPAFGERVRDAALHVLTAKQEMGLLVDARP